MASPHRVLHCVHDPDRASILLDALRLQILDEARSPASAAEIARRLALPRQRVNYHVRQLAEAGFLESAGERRKGNLLEHRWRATAQSYLLAPGVLGPLAAGPRHVADRTSAAYLLALTAQVQDEMARVQAEAEAVGERVPTLSVGAEVRFESAEQRAAFARALRAAVAQVVEDFSSPFRSDDGGAAPGRPYRLALGCYPMPPAAEREALAGVGGPGDGAEDDTADPINPGSTDTEESDE